MLIKGTVKVIQSNDCYIATCLENDVVSQGKTVDEAILNLKEALKLYYEDEKSKEEFNNMPFNHICFTTIEVSV